MKLNIEREIDYSVFVSTEAEDIAGETETTFHITNDYNKSLIVTYCTVSAGGQFPEQQVEVGPGATVDVSGEDLNATILIKGAVLKGGQEETRTVVEIVYFDTYIEGKSIKTYFPDGSTQYRIDLINHTDREVTVNYVIVSGDQETPSSKQVASGHTISVSPYDTNAVIVIKSVVPEEVEVQ